MKKHILFVDDDRHFLSALKRVLRAHRETWDTHFVLNGEAALTALERVPFDVIVSDIAMPGMDGGELLRRVKQYYPDIVRIALSGLADFEIGQRAGTVAHLVLSKPCEALKLRKTIEWACTLEEPADSFRISLEQIGLKQV